MPSPFCRLLAAAAVLLLAAAAASAAGDAAPATAHSVLKTSGLPVGLLPAAVRSYSLNRTSGDFSVELGGSCRFLLPPDNYLASYSRRISGRLVDGRISELDGVRVWAFFKWWSITGIRARGENLVFEVGGITAKYPAKNFDESPVCEGQKSDS